MASPVRMKRAGSRMIACTCSHAGSHSNAFAFAIPPT